MALPPLPVVMALPPVERALPLVRRLQIAIAELDEAVKLRVKCELTETTWGSKKNSISDAYRRCDAACDKLRELVAELWRQEHLSLYTLEQAKAFLWILEKVGERGALRKVQIDSHDSAVRAEICSLLRQNGFTGIAAAAPAFAQ